VISIFIPFLSINLISFLDEYFILMGEGDNTKPSQNYSCGSSTGNSEASGGNKAAKPKKPNLTIKVGAQNEAEQDRDRIGKCRPEDMTLLEARTQEQVDKTLCDFAGDEVVDGKPVSHKAFESISDHALLCKQCNGMVCKNCQVEY
jgi:hypothetical protein